jgi:GT2 family glycosyltransferase
METIETRQSPAKSVGVVIPYYRAPEALKKTIAHLQIQRNVRSSVFVRDNSEDNILFTRAVNEGLTQFAFNHQFDYTLILNQDAYLHEECLSQMLAVMESNPKAGICGAIALSPNKSVNWAGSGSAFPWGQHLSYDLTKLPKQAFQTHWVNGACMLIRNAMVKDIGLLDANMRFICSDADYSFTARARGWQCLVSPNAFVEHELSGSAGIQDPFLIKTKLEDQLYFAKKWLSGDLYRALAVEGSSLSPEFVQSQISKTELELRQFEQK